MRDAFLPFARPDLDETEITAVTEVLRSGWLTTGQRAADFEARFAAFIGCTHAIAVNSCTAAMHLALEALGVGPGDEVITSPYTFASTAAVIQHLGARPVFVDVQRDTLIIDPTLVEAAVTPKTKVIMPVHVAGHPADLADLYAIASTSKLAIVEDAAHALPSSYAGHLVGSTQLGLSCARPERSATCFSFYATKTLTTGEGGMVCTDNEAMAERIRLMSLHGLSRDAWKRYAQNGSWFYDIVSPGFKCNMTDIAAAIGTAQLEKIDRMLEKRRAITTAYNGAFGHRPEFETPTERPGCAHSWHLYMLRLNFDRIAISRERFIDELQSLGIGSSVHFIPLHIHSYYRDEFELLPNDLPVAYQEFRREVSLPIYSAMGERDAADVIAATMSIADRFKVAP